MCLRVKFYPPEPAALKEEITRYDHLLLFLAPSFFPNVCCQTFNKGKRASFLKHYSWVFKIERPEYCLKRGDKYYTEHGLQEGLFSRTEVGCSLKENEA